MPDLGVYRPVTLLPAEKAALTALMKRAHEALGRAAHEKYAPAITSPTKRVKKLRDEYKQFLRDCAAHRAGAKGRPTNPLWFDPQAQAVMHQMIDVESRVINGYIKVAIKHCDGCDRYFADRPGVTYQDYVQQAADAIYDAQYTYDGTADFSTYVYLCAKRRLIDFVRHEHGQSHVNQVVRRLRREVRQSGISCNEAIGRLRSTGKISESGLSRIRGATLDACRVDHTRSEVQAALDAANLNPTERQLIEARMSGTLGECVKALQAVTLNRRTGRPVTKQAIYDLYYKACSKVRLAYLTVDDTNAA